MSNKENLYNKYFILPYDYDEFLDSFNYFIKVKKNVHKPHLLNNYLRILFNSFKKNFVILYLKETTNECEFQKIMKIIEKL
jgi:hypothetical protein